MKTVFCPVSGKEIGGDACLLICDVADHFIKPTVLPEEIEWSEEQRSRCQACAYHADLCFENEKEP